MSFNKSFANSLVKISLLSVSVASLNVTPARSVTTNAPNQVLVAQGVTCSVTNIRTGQLALRFTPNGRSRAGLNNGDTVALLREGNSPWAYVRVIEGPSRQINGVEGWVNSNYLACGDTYSNDSTVSCSVVNIRTGQLALRFTPNGRSRAGLNNGDVVQWIRNGSSPWYYVRVLQGPNRAVEGLEGWVNSNYLSCD